MTELGETTTNLQLPEEIGKEIPLVLHPFTLSKFADGKEDKTADGDYLIEHFSSTDPKYGGDIILMYPLDTDGVGYELVVKKDNSTVSGEIRTVIKIFKNIENNPVREVLGELHIDYEDSSIQFLDQTPNDQQL